MLRVWGLPFGEQGLQGKTREPASGAAMLSPAATPRSGGSKDMDGILRRMASWGLRFRVWGKVFFLGGG